MEDRDQVVSLLPHFPEHRELLLGVHEIADGGVVRVGHAVNPGDVVPAARQESAAFVRILLMGVGQHLVIKGFRDGDHRS